jgi:hypothetical protein
LIPQACFAFAVVLLVAACSGTSNPPTRASSPTACASPSTPGPTISGKPPIPCAAFTATKWHGTINIDGSIRGKASESGTADGTVELAREGAGNVSGVIIVRRTSGCALPPAASTVRVSVAGTESSSEIVLHATGFTLIPSGGSNGICGFPDPFVSGPLEHEQNHDPDESFHPMSVAITSPRAAKGTGTLTEFEYGHEYLALTYSIDLVAQA